MILAQDSLLILTVVIGGLGFIVGWLGAWMVGAFKCVKTCIWYKEGK